MPIDRDEWFNAHLHEITTYHPPVENEATKGPKWRTLKITREKSTGKKNLSTESLT